MPRKSVNKAQALKKLTPSALNILEISLKEKGLLAIHSSLKKVRKKPLKAVSLKGKAPSRILEEMRNETPF
ncbi:MAG TPA: hypothetical protein VNN20_06535 [Thermodesulfobacteriota bacterium]|nr:hypothetical protein [Thermodesulfobacteriota bacterium]